jgi:ADP-heptose:LPS heptosyltransferase
VSDTLVKRIEIGFRRFLIRLLSRLVRRSKILTSHIDYNTCKFLFIRQDKIGDVLISTPLFAALKKKYPMATLDVLLSRNNYFVLANDPLIRKHWVYRKNIGSAFKVLREIRREQYDFVIDLMDNPSVTSTMLCLFAGARWTVGVQKENAFAYDVVVPMLSRRDTHIIDRIGRLLEPFGIDVTHEKLAVRYYTSLDSQNHISDFFAMHRLDNREIVGINISAGSEVRFWGIHHYRELMQRLKRNFPESVLLILYKPQHRERAEQISKDMSGCILSPLTESFDQFAAFVQRCTFLITPDTSAVHLAAAFGVPSVVLYVQSNKELRVWEPYGVDHESIVADVDDLSVISVVDVLNSFGRLYNRTRIDHSNRKSTS